MSATPNPQPPPIPEEQWFVLRGIDWETYRNIADALDGRHVRLSYDGENLELAPPSPSRSNYGRLLGRFIVVLTEEFGLPVKNFGDMTMDREDLRRGVEADDCFYLINEPAVRDKHKLDFAVDLPPDLAVEIDISRSSLARMAIYAELRVPEVWRFDGAKLQVFQLSESGHYAESQTSQYFPGLPVAGIADFLGRWSEMDENALASEFRAWAHGFARS